MLIMLQNNFEVLVYFSEVNWWPQDSEIFFRHILQKCVCTYLTRRNEQLFLGHG